MARLVALVACIAAAAAFTAVGSSSPRPTWFVTQARLLSPSFGYAVAGWRHGGGLYLYRDGRWSLSSAHTDGQIEDVAFPDERHGWIASQDCVLARVSVYGTVDGGASWRRLPIRTTHSCGGGPTYLSFLDESTGWLEPVSPNGPGGLLFRTRSGGMTWRLVNSGVSSILARAPTA